MTNDEARQLAALQVEVRHISENTKRIAESLEKTLDKHATLIDKHEIALNEIRQQLATQAAATQAAVRTSKAWYSGLAILGGLAWGAIQVALKKFGVI